MSRSFGLMLASLLIVASSSWAITTDEENVNGLARLREDLFASIRDKRLDTAGPWTLRYTGPMERGTRVTLKMQPEAAFKTIRRTRTEFNVQLKNKWALFTKVVKEVRPIGIKVVKTFEEPGEGKVYVTFQNKRGDDLPLTKLNRMKMIRGMKWIPKEAASFLGYQGIEAGFRRKPGHEGTTVEVILSILEEGHEYFYSAWLPRMGDSVAIAPKRCREERVFTSARLVTLRTPWLKSGPSRFVAGAASSAQDRVWKELQTHCEGTLGGELVQDTVKVQHDCGDNEHCVSQKDCSCAASATYQCKIRQYETVEICN